MRSRLIIYGGILAVLLAACQRADDIVPEKEDLPSNAIRVGGISADELVANAVVSKVEGVEAETIDWLLEPLFSGLDITYGKSSDRSNTERVAFLKLEQASEGVIKRSEQGLAEYSFFYRDDNDGHVTDDPAIWYDNGAHFFEGVYVPGAIQYQVAESETVEDVYGAGGSAVSLDTDQHTDATSGTLGNYTLLSHYLGMPSGFTLNATVARVKLPFRHRLARVLAYILIDPVMEGVTLAGYKRDAEGDPADEEDATTTSLRFCDVKVLEGVQDSYDAEHQHHTYTPQWGKVRKAIPHFVGERGSYDDNLNESYDDDHFIAYYNTTKKTFLYPTDSEWHTVYAHNNEFVDEKYGNYERTRYGTVPVYDLIVRPTYTSESRVMYDEVSPNNTASQSNQIEFDITLSNGLHYTKVFEFDLDANYQTVVYLHISREHVDYNSSGSALWQETVSYDDWYGVNNRNGNTLSKAGSGWQRAYTYGATFNEDVTDGHAYNADDPTDPEAEDPEAQYVGDSKWIEMLFQAHQGEGGTHHGDYFILKNDITISANDIPEDFVFTGHLDGLDHTITITDANEETFLFAGLNGKYSTAQEENVNNTWEANVHKEGSYWVPYTNGTDGWRAEIINTRFVMAEGSVFKPESAVDAGDGAVITGYLHNCRKNGVPIPDYIPSIPEYNAL